MIDRVQPTLPDAVSNLDKVGDVGLTYRDNLEALLVRVTADAWPTPRRYSWLTRTSKGRIGVLS